MNTKYVVRTALIAALHAVVTILVMQTMLYLSWGPVQFRLSEALTVLPLYFAEAVPGLAIGTFLANLLNMALTGAGPLGLLDVVFGTLATLLGALWTRRLRKKNIALALAGPVLTNALIVAAYLPIILKALGFLEFYQIPFTTISMNQSFGLMYLFGVISVGFGQAVVIYALGTPLAAALRSIIARHPKQGD